MTPVLSSMATHATSATVGWTLPRTTLEVLRFELRWRPSTENAWPDDVVNIPSTESSHTITGLAPDTEYAVQVRAVFADGVGEWSEPLIVTTDRIHRDDTDGGADGCYHRDGNDDVDVRHRWLDAATDDSRSPSL